MVNHFSHTDSCITREPRILPSFARVRYGRYLACLLNALLLTSCTTMTPEPGTPGNMPPPASPGPAASTDQSSARQPALLEESVAAESPGARSGPGMPTGQAARQARQDLAKHLPPGETPELSTAAFCHAVGSKLGSVTTNDCLRQQLIHDGNSPLNHSLAYKDYLPVDNRIPLGRVLVIGGIHGDEYSSVSLMFKWMDILNQHHSGMFHWRFIPLANPDGLLRSNSQRQNHSGVDLNRNFPTADWNDDAHRYWTEVAYSNPRRNPGATAASEPETRWLIAQIEQFRPDVIISVHAPHHLVDYDGPPSAPDKLGHLGLNKLGVFPGSLGNYAGIGLGLPVVTVELPSAGIMPAPGDIDGMWRDLVGWLRRQLADADAVRSD